jgi:hypothetical protein
VAGECKELFVFFITSSICLIFFKESVIQMANTNKEDLIEQYLHDRINLLQMQFNQLMAALQTQSSSCPEAISLSTIDSSLEEFIRLHHIDVMRTVKYHVNQFRDDIHEKQLWQQLSSQLSNEEQVRSFVRRIYGKDIPFDFRNNPLIVSSHCVNNS